MNNSWKSTQPLSVQRQYLALLCAMRINTKDVLGFYDSNTAHQNHVHVDNVDGNIPLSTGSASDVKLVKLIINLQLGWTLPLNGTWTTDAQNGYTYVTTANHTQCHNAFGNSWDMVAFLDIVAKNAMSGNGVGFHLGGC
jgi:hypothetical protein